MNTSKAECDETGEKKSIIYFTLNGGGSFGYTEADSSGVGYSLDLSLCSSGERG